MLSLPKKRTCSAPRVTHPAPQLPALGRPPVPGDRQLQRVRPIIPRKGEALHQRSDVFAGFERADVHDVRARGRRGAAERRVCVRVGQLAAAKANHVRLQPKLPPDPAGSELRRRVDAWPLLADGSERQPLHHVAPRREVVRVGEGKHIVHEAFGAGPLTRLRPERNVGIEIEDPSSTAKRRGDLKQRGKAQTLERDPGRTPASRVSTPGDQRLGNGDVRSRHDDGCVVPVDFGECLEEALRDHADTAPSVLGGGRVDYELRHSRREA